MKWAFFDREAHDRAFILESRVKTAQGFRLIANTNPKDTGQTAGGKYPGFFHIHRERAEAQHGAANCLRELIND